jgi:hypothetical protein
VSGSGPIQAGNPGRICASAPGSVADHATGATYATPSLPDALALAIRLAVKRQARLRDESRRNIHLVEQPDRRA